METKKGIGARIWAGFTSLVMVAALLSFVVLITYATYGARP